MPQSKTSVEIQPLDIAKFFRVPMDEVYCRLGVSRERARQLIKNPKQRRRCFVAELEACLEQVRLEWSLESLMRSPK
jgi:hypothetical protein